MATSFAVLYTKANNKKRKVFSDGILQISDSKSGATSKLMTLLSDGGEVVFRRPEKLSKLPNIGDEISMGGFEIQVEGYSSDIVSADTSAVDRPVNSIPPSKYARFVMSTAQKSHPISLTTVPSVVVDESKSDESASSITLASSVLVSTTIAANDQAGEKSNDPVIPKLIDVDRSLYRLLKPHQLEAVDFILHCLCGNKLLKEFQATFNEYHRTNSELNQASVSTEQMPLTATQALSSDLPDKSNRRPWYDSDSEEDCDLTGGLTHEEERVDGSGKRFSGAILADEMGLGKTLSAIAVLWTLVRGRKSRGVVVCPSSLVENWRRELNRWLPNCKLLPLILLPGSDAQVIFNQFRSKMITERNSVLVLSYEMFRKHVDTLNECPGWDILICDEGHRIKNIAGTKTTVSLSCCRATKRLVLTGTPLQNNLDELFTVVTFVAPGILGTYHQFKSLFIAPLQRFQQSGDIRQQSHLFKTLRTYLSAIILRRTHNDMQRGTLPKRTDVTLFCNLSCRQRELYDDIAAELLQSLGLPPPGSSGWSDDDADEDMSSTVSGVCSSVCILPFLQQLRQVCTYGKGDVPMASDSSGGTLVVSTPAIGFDMLSRSAADSKPRFPNSSKLEILFEFLSVQRLREPQTKTVIVSNFTATLDLVADFAGKSGWVYVRLDGSVPVDKRQGMVDKFNRSMDPSFLFLLSAKAGGVGLNLIGATRLFLLDCDWNPATDLQAMARIWRQGQTKPVFIYRLIAFDSIENIILQRQAAKGRLNSVIECNDPALSEVENESDKLDTLQFSVGDVRKLLVHQRDEGLADANQAEDPVLMDLLESRAGREIIRCIRV